ETTNTYQQMKTAKRPRLRRRGKGQKTKGNAKNITNKGEQPMLKQNRHRQPAHATKRGTKNTDHVNRLRARGRAQTMAYVLLQTDRSEAFLTTHRLGVRSGTR